MKKTMMYLPEELHGFLVQEADRRGVSMAAIAREAIADYRVSAKSAPRSSLAVIVGVVDAPGPVTHDARRVDEALAEYFGPEGEWEREHGRSDPR
jgi:hypothetical protein